MKMFLFYFFFQQCWKTHALEGNILPKVWLENIRPDGSAEILRGIETPYVYTGGLYSCFGYHREDQDLFSFNISLGSIEGSELMGGKLW
jgi:hypothetical protein